MGAHLGKWKLTKYLSYRNVLSLGLFSPKDKRPVIPGPLAYTNPMFFKLEILKVKDIFTQQISKFI